jgi:uncharacterized membrane protein
MQPGDCLTRDSDGFRQRGTQVTRLETFVDAAFAFSLTLLVISFNDLPDTVAELRAALRRVPTFVLCFAMLAMFWAAHNRWSRRFGLEDARAMLLSLAFVLVVLVYVYPLRMVISSFLAMLSGGWLPNELGFDPQHPVLDAQTAFMVYSLGFGLLSGIMWWLNAHALSQSHPVPLDEGERYQVRSDIGSHRILTATALLSLLASIIVLAFDLRSGWWVGLPMWVYASLGVVMPAYWTARGRRQPPKPHGQRT